MLRLLFFVVPLVLAIYCLVEAISSREDEVRNLPRVWWILLILFFPFVGSIAWLAAGRPVQVRPAGRPLTGFPEYDRPGRFAASDPAADEEFLRKVRERAEEQRRKGRQQHSAKPSEQPSEQPGDQPGDQHREPETDSDGDAAPA